MSGVDVLEVLARAISGDPSMDTEMELMRARLAVSELIDAADSISTACKVYYGNATLLHMTVGAHSGLHGYLEDALRRVEGESE